MDENPRRTQGAPSVQAPDSETENLYELDLEEHAPADIDEVFKDAVAAVDRSKEGDSPESADTEVDEVKPEMTHETTHETTADRDQLESEASGLRERLMRTLADFDNYRKRTEREKQTLRRFANFDVFKDFLGVLDNFERAMESSGSPEDLKQGLQMIVRQQEEILRRHGVEKIDAVSQPFDPTVHEAVAREESAEVEVPTVTREMQKGYLLHDRLLRPALVFVAMPGSKPTSQSDDGSEGEAGAAD